jgi:PAS domain S-box-containing protein
LHLYSKQEMFRNSWDKISHTGLQNNTGISAAKRIKLSNQLSAIALAFTAVYSIVFYTWHLYTATIVSIAGLFIYASVLFITARGFYLTARFLFIISLYIHLFVLCMCFGEASQIHLLFIPSAAIPLVLFDLRQKWIIAFLVFLAGSTLCMLYLLNFSSFLFVSLPEDLLTRMRIIFNITAILSQIVAVSSFIFNFERTEQKLDKNNELLQQQLQSIFENSFDALFLVDWQKRKIIKANQRAIELFEADAEEEFYELYGLDLHKNYPSEAEMEKMRYALNTFGLFEGEVLYKTRKGKEFWGGLAIRLVKIGNDKYQSVRVTDITMEKKTKAQTEAALREKEILLSEIHHRVKNNLAVISGLLGLQSTYVEDEHSRSLFEESRNRIHSMALIHDKLYNHETSARIDFNSYCKDLLDHINSSYNGGTSVINCSVTCNDVFLDIKNAVPCGLILNELISNAYKHAFTGRSNGEIRIVCTKMGEKFTMMVSDNGIGFDAEKNLEKPVSLGLTLITALVAQVNGTLKTTNKTGSTYYISFEE